MKNRNIINTISAIILALFALLTLFLSSSVIFDWFGIRAEEGNYVLFIVWANFISSSLYLIAVYGFIKRTKWTFWVLITALVILIVAFIALQFHINNGGIYEAKTIKAMIFRMSMTLTFSLVALVKFNKSLWRKYSY
ncbi:hypothetical protein ES692_00460 [Psychroserpens burtonensis]|uniref:DUF4293 family protein n=1 Tax=Psychroserpens burtonensis TaxID=49278 RepID=A0A5C7BE35_9FLAO|nr:hypothetical protein [Psychroserpens burtonensis]TXE20298.1 hypothetical protein ES692_00460 [Psychroserpens burtonensis]